MFFAPVAPLAGAKLSVPSAFKVTVPPVMTTPGPPAVIGLPLIWVTVRVSVGSGSVSLPSTLILMSVVLMGVLATSLLATGGSLTGVILSVTVLTAVSGPPLPVLPWSLVVMVKSTVPVSC